MMAIEPDGPIARELWTAVGHEVRGLAESVNGVLDEAGDLLARGFFGEDSR
jgi:hypothetical protein